MRQLEVQTRTPIVEDSRKDTDIVDFSFFSQLLEPVQQPNLGYKDSM